MKDVEVRYGIQLATEDLNREFFFKKRTKDFFASLAKGRFTSEA
jgi:hypothetical protein